jgi:glycosyltransferase involved in cell wall biosynthesis
MEKTLKIAFVVQRYGVEVNGGAELYCRQLAEKVALKHHVEVLTTCAIDYMTWKNEYIEGEALINNVLVRRFKVDKERNVEKFNNFTSKVINPDHTIFDEIEWMKLQGPLSMDLLKYIKESRDNYDLFIFIPYLYFTTYFGLQLVAEKSILISAAHDEPFIYFDIFKNIFHAPKAIIYLTDEEKAFVEKTFKNGNKNNIVLGAGVDVPDNIDGQRFRKKYGISEPFIIYVGRIDESKGCHELFDYFIRYKKENNNNLKLVLLGKAVMKIPTHPDIIPLGFVSDEDKFDGMAVSEFLVLPSKYESLSMVVLESLKLGRPILVNGQCEVLRGHCVKSNGGLYYIDYEEYKYCINLLIKNQKLNEMMGNNGQEYVNYNYEWGVICKKFDILISDINIKINSL